MDFGSDTGIGNITVSKPELLKILRANRERHHSTFEKALVVFRERAIKELDKLIADVKGPHVPRSLHIGLPVPEEHTDDYDRAIHMLEMHIADVVTLSESAYAKLVDDNWEWRRMFEGTTMAYLSDFPLKPSLMLPE